LPQDICLNIFSNYDIKLPIGAGDDIKIPGDIQDVTDYV
jgi:hypothetical protein